METHFLENTILFRGVSESEIKEMLTCLGGDVRSFEKGCVIYHTGDVVQSLGVVLSGNVHIENDDFWGNRSLLDFCGNLCLCFWGTPDGQCDGFGKDGGSVSEYRTAAADLLQCLQPSQ